MIKVSDHAKEKAIQLMTEDGFNPAEDYIRVGVKSGGCSGLEYVLKFDNQKTDTDQIFEDNNIKIIIDKKSILYLAGTTLEYSGGLNGKGFVLTTRTHPEHVDVENHLVFRERHKILDIRAMKSKI